MKIILIQNIQCKKSKLPNSIYKLFNSDIIPHKGDFINDSIWKEPYQYEVVEVVINYSRSTCEVVVESCKEEWESFDKFLEMAKMHNWDEHYPI